MYGQRDFISPRFNLFKHLLIEIKETKVRERNLNPVLRRDDEIVSEL